MMHPEGFIQVNTPEDARTMYSKRTLLLLEGSAISNRQHTNLQHNC
jgi:hypothetical protein